MNIPIIRLEIESMRAVVQQALMQHCAVSVPAGWKVERATQDRIRVASPDGELWSFTEGCGVSAYEFVYRLLDAVLSVAPMPAQAVPQLTGCNCRWDGETQVQWCELHLAHKEAIHDWAGRAKNAEAKLAAPPPEAHPRPAAWIRWEWNRSGSKSLVFDKPTKLSLSEESRGVVYDPLYAAPSAQAEPRKPNYRAECWPESPHNKQAEQGGK